MKYTIKKHQNGKGTIVIFETDDRNEALVNYKEECEKAQEEILQEFQEILGKERVIT